MADHIALVRAHLDSFMAGKSGDFEKQLTSEFRYRYLPPVFGAGAVQARRWMDVLFRIYATWRYDILDAHTHGNDVLLRVTFDASDPVEPKVTPSRFHDEAFLVFVVEDGRIASCNGSYLEYGERSAFASDASAA